MNICLISREYPPYSAWGGISRYSFQLSQGLALMGHQVSVISFHTKKSPEVEITPYAKVYRPKVDLPNIILGLRNTEYSFSLVSFLKVKELLKTQKFDIIHGNKLEPIFIFPYTRYIKHTPSVMTMHTPYLIHGPMDALPNGPRRVWSRFFMYPSYYLSEYLSAKIASKVIAVSKDLANLLLSYGIAGNKIAVVHNGIDIDKFHPRTSNNALKKKLNLKKYVVLFVGRLERRKGPDILLRAIPWITREVKNVSFVFVGEDRGPHSLKTYMLKMAQKLDCIKDVVFYGKASESELLDFYASCDVFVVPSRYESFGLIVAEAMSMAKPVVAAKVGGIQEIIDDKVNGLFFEPNNSASLAGKVIEVLRDEEFRNRLGNQARRKIEKEFSLDAMVCKTLQVYKQVCNS